MAGGFVVRHTKRKASAVTLDHALVKAYKKPAKSNSKIIGICRRKDSVCRWNINKHEKATFKKFLQELYCLNEYDEYAVHQDYSTSTTRWRKVC